MSFPYKAVLFDWAYTLVDLVEEDDRAAFLRVFDFLRGQGIDLPDFEEFFAVYRELFYGMIEVSRETHREASFEMVLNFLLFQYRIDLQGKTSLEELCAVYYKTIYSPRKVYPDAVPALEKLKSRGVRMGIISNTTNPRFMKDYERAALGLDSYFEFSIYSSEMPYRKPHPSIFRVAVRRLEMEPGEILFVGDDLRSDVEGAHGVGMPAAWLNRDRQKTLCPVRPEYELHSLTDMLNINSFSD